MAFIAMLIPAIIAAAAAGGTAIAGSVESDNANRQAADEAKKNRAFQAMQNQKNINQQALSSDLSNASAAGNAQQQQYAQTVNTIQGAAAQKQKELEGVSDTIAKNMAGA